MRRRSLAFGIVFFVICSVFIPISLGFNVKVTQIEHPSNMDNGNTLYVGGSGPNNYTSIQDAINDASGGDTVFVYSGTYFSIPDNRIVINKKLKIFGEEKNTTIIEGCGEIDVITVIADNVTITGFTIRRNVSDINIGNSKVYVGIVLKSSFNMIYNNFFDEIFGRSLRSVTPHNHIFNNVFFSSNDGVLLWRGSNHSIVENNIFLENGDGIWVVSSWNIIRDNVFIMNYRGIRGDEAFYNLICDNNFLDNYDSGIELYDGVIWGTNLDNKILNNSFFDNSVGILLSCTGSIVEGNIIENSSKYGIKINWGFNNQIKCNIIKNNKMGAYITGSSTKNIITCNNFIKNDGAFLHDFPDFLLFRNNWDRNYWDLSKGNIKIISGRVRVVLFTWYDQWGYPYEFAIHPPWFNIDWNPAKEPYDIEGVV